MCEGRGERGEGRGKKRKEKREEREDVRGGACDKWEM